jgi:hypothetical protein
MQKANVSNGKPKMGNTVRRGELPCVRRFRSLYTDRFVCSAVIMSMERKKVMKKQRRGKKKRIDEK